MRRTAHSLNVKLFASVLAVVVLPACVTGEIIPEDKSPFAIERVPCTKLSGKYVNRGQSTSSSGRSLSSFLGVPVDFHRDQTVTVEVGSADSIAVTVEGGDLRAPVRAQLSNERKPRCEDGALLLEESYGNAALFMLGTGHHETTMIRIYRGPEGSLVIRTTRKAYGFVFFVPGMAENDAWFQFRSAK